MKKLILLALIFITIVLSNCTPSPSPGPATPTPTPTPTPTYTMTATETALVGDWIWDSTTFYNGSLITSLYTPTGYYSNGILMPSPLPVVGSHMNLKSTLKNGTISSPQFFDVDFYPNLTMGSESAWCVANTSSGDKFTPTSLGPYATFNSGFISTLNTNTLIYQQWAIGQSPFGWKIYYHK